MLSFFSFSQSRNNISNFKYTNLSFKNWYINKWNNIFNLKRKQFKKPTLDAWDVDGKLGSGVFSLVNAAASDCDPVAPLTIPNEFSWV